MTVTTELRTITCRTPGCGKQFERRAYHKDNHWHFKNYYCKDCTKKRRAALELVPKGNDPKTQFKRGDQVEVYQPATHALYGRRGVIQRIRAIAPGQYAYSVKFPITGSVSKTTYIAEKSLRLYGEKPPAPVVPAAPQPAAQVVPVEPPPPAPPAPKEKPKPTGAMPSEVLNKVRSYHEELRRMKRLNKTPAILLPEPYADALLAAASALGVAPEIVLVAYFAAFLRDCYDVGAGGGGPAEFKETLIAHFVDEVGDPRKRD